MDTSSPPKAGQVVEKKTKLQVLKSGLGTCARGVGSFLGTCARGVGSFLGTCVRGVGSFLVTCVRGVGSFLGTCVRGVGSFLVTCVRGVGSFLSEHGNFFLSIAPWIVTAGAFVIVGYTIGYLAGASRSPVVATLLPLIVGLLGVSTTLALLNRRVGLLKLVRGLKSIDENTAERIRAEVGSEVTTSAWVPAFGAFGAILFCVALQIGGRDGIGIRTPDLPSVTDLLGNFQTEPPLEPEELADLHALRWHLQSLSISADETRTIFSQIVKPLILKKREKVITKEPVYQNFREEELKKVVNYLISQNPRGASSGSPTWVQGRYFAVDVKPNDPNTF